MLPLSIGKSVPGLKAFLKKLRPDWMRKRQAARRGRKFASQLPEVEKFLATKTASVSIHRQLGVGNVGVVYEAELKGDWAGALGVVWKSTSEPAGRIALKISAPESPRERIDALIPFAEKIDAACRQSPPAPLCPWLAMGVAESAAGGQRWLIQVMPIIAGRSLADVIEEDAPGMAPAQALGQFAAILDTVVFFEECGFYTRNLDADNVIVEPTGRWVRIDYDNAEPRADFPFKRMDRLSRLGLRIVDALGPSPGEPIGQLRNRLQATAAQFQGAGSANGDAGRESILATPGELSAAIREAGALLGNNSGNGS